MPQVVIDDRPYDLPDGQNLLHACLSLGFNLPYFCWHPALGSVGACRQCAVKQFRDENDRQGRLVMACLTPVAKGLRISIDDPEAVQFRASVVEWLMVNHPHDCPICDEGGECHLQDMTVMTGHADREFRFRKRTHRNQQLGPLINHEMNRCIACYRCTRFYRDYAGGRDFDVFSWHDSVYFGRSEDGVLESEFSGNLVEVCPTGVFTDKSLKEHFTRKWDLQTAPSICAHCGVGCNTIPGERYGMLRRIRNRYHHDVNGYFLCDRGRYGYEFVNSPQRIRRSVVRADVEQPALVGSVAGHEARTVTGPQAADDSGENAALACAAGWVARRESVIGIGSPRASLQANFALSTLVGSGRFYLGLPNVEVQLLSRVLEILRHGPARTPSLREIGESDAVLILGEDLTNTGPMMALAVRQAAEQQPRRLAEKLGIPLWNDAAVRDLIQGRKGPLYIAAVHATRLDDVATRTYWAAPDDLARFGFAIAHALDAGAPSGSDVSLAAEIASALEQAERPVVIAGTSCGSNSLLQAAANVARALCKKKLPCGLSFVVPECNSLGLALLGGAGGLEAAATAGAKTIIVLENDLYRRADRETVDRLLGAAERIVAIDHLAHATTEKAHVVLPAATFAEGTGTFVSGEGRAQRYYKVFPPQDEIRESWRWLRDLSVAAGRVELMDWTNIDAIDAAIATALPVFQPITEIAPPAAFRIDGERIPREAHRVSGRTAVTANISVHEPKPPDDLDSPLAFSMEGYPGQPPPPLIPRDWAPGWNSVQSINKFQEEIGGPLRGGDPGRRLMEPGSWEHRAEGAGGVAGSERSDGPEAETADYFRDLPPAFERREHECQVVPIWHIFGSEEQSALSAPITELSPKAYLALCPQDAEKLGVRDGEPVRFNDQQLPAKLMPSLPPGVAGIPIGLPQTPVVRAGTWLKLEKAP